MFVASGLLVILRKALVVLQTLKTLVVLQNTEDAEVMHFSFKTIFLVSFINLFLLSNFRYKMAHCSQTGKQLLHF